MNDKMEIVMRLVAADWPNCSKSEILEHLPDMAEVADALLAAAVAQQSTPDHWYNVARRQVEEIDAFRARAEAAEAKVSCYERFKDDTGAWLKSLTPGMADEHQRLDRMWRALVAENTYLRAEAARWKNKAIGQDDYSREVIELRAKVARLERQLAPLTEDEAREATGMMIEELGAKVSGNDGHLLAVAYVNAADRIRARRSE